MGTHSETDFDKTKLIPYDQAIHTEQIGDGPASQTVLKGGYRLFFHEPNLMEYQEMKSDGAMNLGYAHTDIQLGYMKVLSAITYNRIGLKFTTPKVDVGGPNAGTFTYSVDRLFYSKSVKAPFAEDGYDTTDNIPAGNLLVLPPDPKGGV